MKLRWSIDAQPHFVAGDSIVFSTAPGWPSEGRPARAGRAVMAVRGHDGRLTWPGSGGYWRWTFPNAVEREDNT